ncbi:MAG: hypothetical protein K1X67_23195 [Fimbriimonadaceae bacterium]|nr:hypothetical protein [Fimbriimonadaceae bacterium]
MLLAIALGLTLQTKPFDFLGFGPYISGVPNPAQVLGYGPGERHTPYHDQERFLAALEAKGSERLRIIPYGKSTEGRRLRIAVIGSPSNLARLDEIKANLGTIATADPTKNLDELIAKTPVVVWINENIHGDESASFESGMWLIYTLVASQNPAVTKALDEALVIVNPCYNPDGHERFVVWYNSIAIGSSNPDAFEQRQPDIMGGRTNHYRFDMNRDRISFSQAESRQEAAAVLQWRPQVYADQHGEVDGYFFPPCPMSINENVGRERYAKWTRVFGKANADAFDKNGWLYFIGKEYDLYYAGYLDSFNALTGAIGMTHETNGGSRLAIDNSAGGVVTLRDGMMKHFTTALTLIQSSAANRKELLTEYAAFKRDAMAGKSAGDFQRVVVSGDPRALKRFGQQLAFGGVKSTVVGKAFRQRGTDYWTGKAEDREIPAGSVVVDMDQEQGAYAKALLEPGSNFEPEFIKRQQDLQKARQDKERYPGRPGPEFYDMTGWSAVYGHGLDAMYCKDKTAFEAGIDPVERRVGSYGKVGAWWSYTDQSDILTAYDLLDEGVRVDLSTEPLKLGGETIPKGSFLVLREHQEVEEVEAKLVAAAGERGSYIHPLDTGFPDTGAAGPLESTSIEAPKIKVVFGSGGDTTGFGGMWYAMEQTFRLPFTPVFGDALDDPGDATCIVCPPGGYGPPSEKLKSWVREGGRLVILEGGSWALGEKGFATFETKRATNLPGSLFLANLNPRSIYGSGYDPAKPISVPVAGGSFPKVKPEGGAVVSFGEKPRLLSGWAWDDTEAALGGTVWFHDQPYGRGHVLFFAQDPTERALWPGLARLLLNAMLLG